MQDYRELRTPPPPPPGSVWDWMKMPLHQLDDHWLDVQCSGCGQSHAKAIKMLSMRLGTHWLLCDIVARLRCETCRARPLRVFLCETGMRKFCYGGRPGWSIQLLGEPEPYIDPMTI